MYDEYDRGIQFRWMKGVSGKRVQEESVQRGRVSGEN